MAAPSKRGPPVFILALSNSIEPSLPSWGEFTLFPLASGLVGDTKGQVDGSEQSSVVRELGASACAHGDKLCLGIY